MKNEEMMMQMRLVAMRMLEIASCISLTEEWKIECSGRDVGLGFIPYMMVEKAGEGG